MIALRLDRRLSARVDPSDVLQETMIQAHQKLPEYLRTQPIPFYPWLRRLAWENIVQLHRQHILAQARAVTREEQVDVALPDQSAVQLAERLIGKGSSANRKLIQKELKERVQAALGQLDPRDREVLNGAAMRRYWQRHDLPRCGGSAARCQLGDPGHGHRD
jgi:RNA polymerase sigma-70 factor (ECF subfamily)